MRLIRRPSGGGDDGERGAAIITVMIVMFVLMSFGAVSLTLTSHTVSSSARRRDRVAAVHAAEAGLNEALKQLATPAGATWCGVAASPATVLPGGGGAGVGGQQFAVAVSDSHPADGPCTPTDPTRLIVASGYSPSATAPNPSVRRMQAEVRLLPQAATPTGFGFDKAILADGPLTLVNSAAILGDGTGDNADVYSNDSVTISNSTEVHGDIVSQGSVTLGNNVVVWGGIYAAGDVTLSNSARVYGNVVSAAGSATLVHAGNVSGYIRAAGTISLGNNWTVGSTTAPGPCPPDSCLAGSPSPPPPVETLPDFTWDPSDPAWPQPVTSWSACADFLTWLEANRDDFRGTHRISPSCGLTLSGSTTVTLTGDAAIVTDGWIRFENQTKFVESGDRKLYLISLYEPGDPDRGIEFANSTLIEPDTLIYARNKVTKSNSTTISGQIFAEFVEVRNAYTHNFRQVNAPGFTVAPPPPDAPAAPPAGYRTQLLYLREVD